jgi:hypothetical protein
MRILAHKINKCLQKYMHSNWFQGCGEMAKITEEGRLAWYIYKFFF